MSGLESGPIALFTESGDTIVISPFSQFMAASAVYSRVGGRPVVGWGIIGMALQIPRDFVYSTIIYHSEGVNRVGLVLINFFTVVFNITLAPREEREGYAFRSVCLYVCPDAYLKNYFDLHFIHNM